MNLRVWVRNHQAAAAGIALVVLLAAGGLAFLLNAPDRVSTNRWFYDTGSGSLYSLPETTVPPVPGSSGKESVRAYVWACGRCPGSPGAGDIDYLMKYNDEAKTALSTKGPVEGGARAGSGQGATEQGGPDENGIPRAPQGPSLRRFEVVNRGTLVSKPGGEWVAQDSADGAALLTAARAKCSSPNDAHECTPR